MPTLTSIKRRLERMAAGRFGRKLASRSTMKPIISFTFDDFPRSALSVGGKMLKDVGARGTYYTSWGLMGKTTAVGEMFIRQDVEALVHDGHELACHTLEHVMCCDVSESDLVRSCKSNDNYLATMVGGSRPRSFSFPEGVVTVPAKAALTPLYDTCRTIEPGLNCDPVDLGFLRANRVYTEMDVERARTLIDQNSQCNGWLIFYTHDVLEKHSRYGTTPECFRKVVEYAANSGSEILPVGEAASLFAASSTPN